MRESSTSGGFRPTDSGGPPSSQTSFAGTASDEHYPLCTQEHQALDESFSRLNRSADLDPSTEILLPHIKSGAQTLEQRMEDVWPKLPVPGLNQAPLAVIWEVTRIPQYCGVEASDWDLNYRPSDVWHDQTKLRCMIANHGPFSGKGLPHASDSQAWAFAMDGFQSPTKAVTLSADLVCRSCKAGPLFELHLNPLKLELGHRLSRRFGADRFLEKIMPSPSSSKDRPPVFKNDETYSEKFFEWLTEKSHYFLGRFWVPFYMRDFKKTINSEEAPKHQFKERVFLFASDGNHFRMPYTRGGLPPLTEALKPGIRTKLKLSGLLEWAIAIQRNAAVPAMKLFSRISLSLTRTHSTVVLERAQIRNKTKDLKTGKVIMNDGIGQMSRSLARKIADCLGLDYTPAGYQGRIGSAKGVWIIDVDDDGLESDDWIETYESQEKWECDFQDVHHRTFEVKNWPRDVKSESLNKQFISVLQEQAIDRMAMRQTIAEHLVNNLISGLGAQKASLDHPADLRLWLRQTGQSRGGSVFHGHVPFLAGLPDSDEDAIAYLLDSGFDQQKLKYIQTRSFELARKKADNLRQKLHVQIPQSTNMIMVADFSGTLEEGEVHVSFASSFEVEGFCDTLLEGMDILVGRCPAHLGSDIQKVRAVSHPKLRKLKNVAVFSTKGAFPLADLLSGGDYDGNIAWICWDRKIVDNFKNTSVPQCPVRFEGILNKRKETFQDLCAPGTSIDDRCVNFVRMAFAFNGKKSFLGVCTKYKEEVCYTQNTISSPESILLSKLNGYLVDAPKQGILFTGDDWKKLKKDHIKTFSLKPAYDEKKRPIGVENNDKTHILDYLKFYVADPAIENTLAELQRAVKSENGQCFDADLTKMYNSFDDRAKTSPMWKELLKQLCKDVELVRAKWEETSQRMNGESRYVATVKEIYQLWLDILPSEQVRLLELVQVLMEPWIDDPHSSQWALLKASATFKLFHKRGEDFTWRIAGRQLCIIKSKMTAVEGETQPAVVQPEMYASLRPDKRFIVARRVQRGLSREGESVAALEEVLEFDDYGMVLDDP